MHLHENANRHVRENARCNAAMQIGADLRAQHRPHPEEPPRKRAAPLDEEGVGLASPG